MTYVAADAQKSVAMGQSFLLDTYSAAIRSDGTLWTWGCIAFGQLGYGAVTGAIHTPAQVTRPSTPPG